MVTNDGEFTAGGLFRSNGQGEESDPNKGEALVAKTVLNGQGVLVLAFRGSDGFDAASERQTFDADKLYDYYRWVKPVIDAAAAYAQDPAHGIETVVVSGHSLGGTIVDLFALADTELFADKELHLVSMASAGIEPHIARYEDELDLNLTPSWTEGEGDDKIVRQLSLPSGISSYTTIAHTEDRVYNPFLPGGWGLNSNFLLEGNLHYYQDDQYIIDLPNINNYNVEYYGSGYFGFNRHGFGAEHNGSLYWVNIDGIIRDELFSLHNGHNIILGNSDYWLSPDYNGVNQFFYGAYVGPGHDDTGYDRTLDGTVGRDYILGLTGSDTLNGDEGDDLLSGGPGNDTLGGDNGADILHGGTGFDTLSGGANADTFVLDQSSLTIADRITDYSSAEGDSIDISAIVSGLVDAGENPNSLWKLETLPAWSGLTVMVLVDRDGAGSQGFTPVAKLDGLVGGDTILVTLKDSPVPVVSVKTVLSPPGSYKLEVSGSGSASGSAAASAGTETATTTLTPTQTVSEDVGSVFFTITRPVATFAETVYVSTTIDRGSINDEDYDPWFNEELIFAAGEPEKTIEVIINNDNNDETVEQFGLIVQSSPSQPASQYLASSSFTIIDDDSSGSSPTFTTSSDTEWVSADGGATGTFDGLAGNDTVVLDLTSLTANAGPNSGTYRVRNGGSTVFTFSNVENFLVIGGNGADSFSGGAGSNFLLGGGGNDSLTAGPDTDVLDGGSGDDTFNGVGYGDTVEGGSGHDRVYFDLSSRSDDLTINIFTGEVTGGAWSGIEQIGGSLGSGDDTVVAGGNFQSILGGDGTDSLTLDYSDAIYTTSSGTYPITRLAMGSDSSGHGNSLRYWWGVTSDQTISLTGFESFNITGTDGNDSLYGGPAGNRFFGLGGTDYLKGAAGIDFLDGGDGNDTLDGQGGSDTASYGDAPAAVTVSLALTGAQNTGGAGTDTLNNIENLAGSAHADVLTGNDGANSLSGGGGNDTLEGRDGDDVLDGGADADTASYASAAAGVTVNLALAAPQDTGGAGSDTLVDIENLTGSSHADTLAGNAGANVLNGGAGIDTASYASATAGVTVSLALAGPQNTIGGGTDTLIDIENLIGSAHNDTLYGDGGANAIAGGNGNDLIDGRGGVDVLDGGEGSDVFLIGGASEHKAAEIVDTGAAGTDEVRYTATTAGTLTLFAGDTGIETVVIGVGTGASANRLRNTALNVDASAVGNGLTILGNAGNNVLTGTAFDDVFSASAGYDTVNGGAGNDTLNGNNGGDTLNGGPGNDTLNGGPGNDALSGGENDDVLDGGLGDDSLSGGGGIDTASYASATGPVTVSLAIFVAQNTVNAGMDTLAGIENLIGSDYNDTLTGNGQANVLYGGIGNDRLNGGNNNDTLYGGVFNDTLNGDAGADTLYGEGGIDTLNGGSENDTLDGGGGNDTLNGGAGKDTLTGGLGADKFVFSTVADTTLVNPDTITDYKKSELDKIDVSAIDAIAGGADDAFAFLAGGAFNATPGKLIAVSLGGTSYRIEGDIDGNNAADFAILVTSATAIDAGSFIL